MTLAIGPTLVIATHNPGKLKEIADLIAPMGIDCVSAGALGLPEPEETGATFIANAELKARAAAQDSGLPALADDSGFAVAALDGAPGIYSARWAETDAGRDFGVAMERVWQALVDAGVDAPRHAHFICALSLAFPDGRIASFEGRVEGEVTWPPRGGHGFGYDPMFVPRGESETFGEMLPDRKHRLSHRARAFAKLIAAMDG